MQSALVHSPQLLTVRETAHRLRVSEKTVRRLIASGELPAVRLGRLRGQAVRVDAGELARWLYSEAPVHFVGDEAA